MHKAKLKISFFESEIAYTLSLQEQLEKLKTSLKQSIAFTDGVKQLHAVKDIYSRYKALKESVENDNKNTKKNSDLHYDENRFQGEFILKCVEGKVDELNERLYLAENGVQKAEAIKKQQDQSKIQYQVSNVKTFKYASEVQVIDKYLEAQVKIIYQFKRSISLMMRIGEKERQGKNGHTSEVQKLLRMKASNLSFREMKRLESMSERKAKSQERNVMARIEDRVIKSKQEPLVALLLKSPHTPYKKQRELSLKSLITRLRENNKKQTLSNKLLSQALEEKDRDQVLKYLQSKQELNEEESIMKIQLMSAKLSQGIDQRLLCLKLGKKSNQYEQRLKKRNKELALSRNAKSLEKGKKEQQRETLPVWAGRSEKVMNLHFEKPFTSNPKTNDSLTNGHINC